MAALHNLDRAPLDFYERRGLRRLVSRRVVELYPFDLSAERVDKHRRTRKPSKLREEASDLAADLRQRITT